MNVELLEEALQVIDLLIADAEPCNCTSLSDYCPTIMGEMTAKRIRQALATYNKDEAAPVAKNEAGRITWLVDDWPQNCLLYTHSPEAEQRKYFSPPSKWTDEEIANDYRGIRWVAYDGVYGVPSMEDIAEFFGTEKQEPVVLKKGECWPEEVMQQWDYWRKEIANGHKGSAPRDWFEGLSELRLIDTNQPKREWVGLTDEEIDLAADVAEEQAHGFIQGAEWAEAKLKEKNSN